MAEGIVGITDEEEIDNVFEWGHAGVPRCGTVGCIAGWCCIIGAPDRFELGHCCIWGDLAAVSADLLGFDGSHRLQHLFYETQWPSDLREELKHTAPGTMEYAKVAAKRIDRFIEEQGW
jgi:hypothetical protein